MGFMEALGTIFLLLIFVILISILACVAVYYIYKKEITEFFSGAEHDVEKEIKDIEREANTGYKKGQKVADRNANKQQNRPRVQRAGPPLTPKKQQIAVKEATKPVKPIEKPKTVTPPPQTPPPVRPPQNPKPIQLPSPKVEKKTEEKEKTREQKHRSKHREEKTRPTVLPEHKTDGMKVEDIEKKMKRVRKEREREKKREKERISEREKESMKSEERRLERRKSKRKEEVLEKERKTVTGRIGREPRTEPYRDPSHPALGTTFGEPAVGNENTPRRVGTEEFVPGMGHLQSTIPKPTNAD